MSSSVKLMTNCHHQQILQTTAGRFCRDCGKVQIYKAIKRSQKPLKGVGIAKIWER